MTVRASISTKGDLSGSTSKPNLPGGSVQITAGPTSTITVGSITTGGADAPATPGAERGNISLNAQRIVATGDFDTTATSADTDGSLDRSIAIDELYEAGADRLLVSGGAISFNGAVQSGAKSATDPTLRDATLAVTSSGATTFASTVNLGTLQVDSAHGGDVIFGGNITAAQAFDVLFNTTGTGRILTTGGPFTVVRQSAVLTAGDIGAKNPATATTANMTVDPNLHFNLLDVAADPAVAGDSGKPGRFRLDQDAAIDANATALLFTPDRFSVTSPVPFDPANPTAPQSATHAGLGGETVEFLSHAGVSLDEHARDSVAGSHLVVSSAGSPRRGARPAEPGLARRHDMNVARHGLRESPRPME